MAGPCKLDGIEGVQQEHKFFPEALQHDLCEAAPRLSRLNAHHLEDVVQGFICYEGVLLLRLHVARLCELEVPRVAEARQVAVLLRKGYHVLTRVEHRVSCAQNEAHAV